ncbi:hypothetical protein Y032_0187g1133 [Ancylostoma ceylanicum]|uniref:Uncharacterized protein n=1 Tax=Ancylostoma ceylanicum TaxID=53326 RepID=A0A016SR94_9BILA|nr:hypothetical protein Y032_0187g1133 [Ancylostoma ceylanicum]
MSRFEDAGRNPALIPEDNLILACSDGEALLLIWFGVLEEAKITRTFFILARFVGYTAQPAIGMTYLVSLLLEEIGNSSARFLFFF